MAIKMDNYGNVYNDELFHYGKKGMKWGKHVMAQEKYWLTGNGRNLGGDMNSRMASDTSGIQWKRTVAPSGGFKPAGRNTTVQGNRYTTPGGAYDPHKSAAALNRAIRKGNVSINPDGAKRRASKVVPTSNPGIKGVNITATRPLDRIPINNNVANMYRTNNAPARYKSNISRSEKKHDLDVSNIASSNTFRSSVQKKTSNALKTGISAVGQKPDKIKKAKKKAAVGILKLASKLMKWF